MPDLNQIADARRSERDSAETRLRAAEQQRDRLLAGIANHAEAKAKAGTFYEDTRLYELAVAIEGEAK